jgi:hypothetical protein
MKLKFFLSITMILLLGTGNIFSQGIDKGLEGAITTSTVKITDIKDADGVTLKGDAIMGYEGGFWLRVKLGPLYVKPKLLFHYEEGKLDYTVNATAHNVTFSAGKVLVPVLLGFKFLPPVLSLEAGPVFNYVVTATKEIEGQDLDISKSGLGYRVGLNAEFSIIGITVSYQGVKNASSGSLAGYDTPNMLVFGVGIKF